jgi:glycosyltransferase involved in cell wall biosynthesis
MDRFIVTPLALAGRQAPIVHVVDPGNILYLNVIRHAASVVTVHDVIPFLCVEGRLRGFTPTAAGRRLLAAIRHSLKRVDQIICVSECTRRDLLSLVALDPGRVTTIPNAVFQPMQRAEPEACARVRQRLGLPTDAPIVLHVGSNDFYKNRLAVVGVFAKLAARHASARLLFVGPRTPDLEERAAALGVADRVQYVDKVPANDLAAVYSLASVLLFPSLYEGFGYPVLEAQLCGTPVVCSNAGSLPEVGGNAVLAADPLDVDALAAAVDRVLTEPDLCASLRRAGAENAHRFDPVSWREAHDRLYAKLLPAACRAQPAAEEQRA